MPVFHSYATQVTCRMTRGPAPIRRRGQPVPGPTLTAEPRGDRARVQIRDGDDAVHAETIDLADEGERLALADRVAPAFIDFTSSQIELALMGLHHQLGKLRTAG
jgi:hypothetical protein